MIGQQNEYNGSVFFVKPVTKIEKKAVEPYFSFKKKVEAAYKETQQSKAFSGNLEKVETYEREWEGVKSTCVKTTIVDGEEKYVLDMPFSIMSRSVFNSLLSLESYENLKFTIYLTKPKAGGDGKRFPQISVWQGDTLVKWQYAIADLPETKKVRLKGQDMLDTEDLDLFFIEKINEKFGNGGKKAESAPAAPDKKAAATSTKKAAPTKSSKVEDSDPSDSEVPF